MSSESSWSQPVGGRLRKVPVALQSPAGVAEELSLFRLIFALLLYYE